MGTCYAAGGATYTGRTAPVTYRIFPDDAALLHLRILAKYRAGDPNARGLELALVAHGAPPRALDDDPARYLDRLLPRLTQPFRHGGLHRYASLSAPMRGPSASPDRRCPIHAGCQQAAARQSGVSGHSPDSNTLHRPAAQQAFRRKKV